LVRTFELDKASIDCANELQGETGQPYGKDATDGVKVWRAYNLDYRESPPTRLLSLALIVNYWLGYHDVDKGHCLHDEEIGARGRLNDAYEKGMADNPNKG
jgi:hypothetical protein